MGKIMIFSSLLLLLWNLAIADVPLSSETEELFLQVEELVPSNKREFFKKKSEEDEQADDKDVVYRASIYDYVFMNLNTIVDQSKVDLGDYSDEELHEMIEEELAEIEKETKVAMTVKQKRRRIWEEKERNTSKKRSNLSNSIREAMAPVKKKNKELGVRFKNAMYLKMTSGKKVPKRYRPKK